MRHRAHTIRIVIGSLAVCLTATAAGTPHAGAVMFPWVTTSTAAGLGFTAGYGVSALPDGGAIVTGQFRGRDVNLGDGTLRTSAANGLSDSSFTQGLRADGTVAWVTTSSAAGSSVTAGNGVSALPDGGAIVTGGYQGTGVNLGDGTPHTSANNGGSRSSFTQRLRAGGGVVWVTTSTGGAGTIGSVVSALPDGGVIVTGRFSGTGVNLGDGTLRTSANGGGSFSSFTQMLLDLPQAPPAPRVLAGDQGVVGTISALAGGSITSYTLTAAPGGRSCTIAPPATTCTVTGLVNGTSYTLTARAANAAGEGPASAASNTVTPTALTATVLPRTKRLVSGRTMRVAIRARNRATATAVAVTSCLGLPANLVVTRKAGATRSGRTLCFRVGDIAPGATATRTLTVRAVATRRVVRTITGTARPRGLTRVRATPAKVTITPPARATG